MVHSRNNRDLEIAPGPDMPHSTYLQTALEAARAAAEIIRHYYRKPSAVRIKEDDTPVTAADIEAEEAIRTVIGSACPGHGIYGEEHGRQEGEGEYLWLVDPLDGTKSFVRRYPFFSTQIALMRRGELILGVSSAPEMNEIAWAEQGGGAWLCGERVRVSDIDALKDCTLSTGNLRTLAASRQWQGLGSLVSRVDRVRGFGDFYHYHLLAAGKLDVVIESDVNILDIAALSVIVTEAGGRFTDLEGEAPGLDTHSVVATNGRLHSLVLGEL